MRTFLIAAIFAMAAATAGQAQESCQLKQFDSIDMTNGAYGVTVPVTVNGVTKDFALAFQNASNTVSEIGAKQLGLEYKLPPESMRKQGMGLPTVAQTFQIGKIPAKNIPLQVILSAPSQAQDFAIGSRILQNFDLELDMERGKLNLFSTDHCPRKVVYWTKSVFAMLPFRKLDYGFLTLDMQLDDKSIRAALGTGKTSGMSMKAFKRIFSLDENSPGMVLEKTTDTGAKVYHYAFKNLNLDGLNVANPQIEIWDTPEQKDCGDRAERCINSGDLRLGDSILSKLHLYISEKEKIVYITPATAR